MTSAAPTVSAAAPPWHARVSRSTILITVVTVVVMLAFGAVNNAFLGPSNLSNLITQMATVLTIGVAMTFVITAGEIDLSVGSIAAFSAANVALLVERGVDSAIALVLCTLAGGVWGLINGWFVAYQRIPSFIVTLATMSAVRGVALLQTQGYSTPIPGYTMVRSLAASRFLGLSGVAWVSLLVLAIGLVLAYGMRFGQYVTGIGSSEESVRRAGVNTRWVKMWAFGLAGLTSGLAGVLIAGRLGSGSANSGTGLELTVITAVAIGGTAMAGGRGSMTGTLVGAILITAIANGLTVIGVSPFITPIVTGAVLLLAIWINLRAHGMPGFLKKLTRT